MRLRPGLGRARNGTEGPGLEGPDSVSPLLPGCVGFPQRDTAVLVVLRLRFLLFILRRGTVSPHHQPRKNSKIHRRPYAPRSCRAAASCSVMDRTHEGPGRALYFCLLYRMCTGQADGQGRPPFSYMIQQYRRHASYRPRKCEHSRLDQQTIIQAHCSVASIISCKLGRYFVVVTALAGQRCGRAGLSPVLRPLQTRQPVLAAGLFLPAPFAIPSRPRCWRPPGLWVRGSARTSTSTENAPKHSVRNRRRWER